MREGLLVGRELEVLRAAPLTYAEVGSRSELPDAYHHVQRQTNLGEGAARFEEAVRILLSGGMHRRAGLRVRATAASAASAASLADERVAVLHLGVGMPP